MSKKQQIKIPKDALDQEAWLDLAFDQYQPDLLETKLTKDQLSVYVTHFNLPNGTKSSPKMMAVYIKMHLAGQLSEIKNLYAGEKFEEFKLPRIKKELAKQGILPEGTFAELSVKLLQTEQFKSLIKQSRNMGGQQQGQQSQNKQQTQKKEGSGSVIDGVIIAKEVLRLGQEGKYEEVLSQLGTKITKTSTIGEMKKAYLKLSLLIHPDKLSHYDDAKKAFQELVDAYERLSKPEKFQDTLKNTATNKTTIRRPNTGCYKTSVYCPRCRAEWNTKMDGNPEFAYTLMMTGLKNYHCSQCLLGFGCISAIHKCPFCKKGFEYHPDDFHRKVKCGNEGCKREFGFFEDYIQDRVMKEIKEQIMYELEQRMKKEDSKQRRARAYNERNKLSPEEQKLKDEQAYLIGLNDLCPKCGIDLHELEEGTDQYKHLRECNDENRQKEYQKQKELKKKQEELKQKEQNKQNEVQNSAVFNAFGGQNTMLWLLTEEQLRKECKISGIDETGSKDDMIIRLSEHRKDQKALGGDNSTAGLPQNLSRMSEEQIKSLLLAQGLDPSKYRTKQKMIDAIERIQIGLDKAPQKLMLGAGDIKKPQNNNEMEEDESETERNSDSEYEQPDLEELERRKQKKLERKNKMEKKLKRKNPINIQDFYEKEQENQDQSGSGSIPSSPQQQKKRLFKKSNL